MATGIPSPEMTAYSGEESGMLEDCDEFVGGGAGLCGSGWKLKLFCSAPKDPNASAVVYMPYMMGRSDLKVFRAKKASCHGPRRRAGRTGIYEGWRGHIQDRFSVVEIEFLVRGSR